MLLEQLEYILVFFELQTLRSCSLIWSVIRVSLIGVLVGNYITAIRFEKRLCCSGQALQTAISNRCSIKGTLKLSNP